MNLKHGVLLLSALVLGACAKSKDDPPAAPFTSDAERAIGQPRFSFVEEKQNIKLTSLSTSEVSELMSCSEKSTDFRADKKKYSVSYGTLFRTKIQDQNSVLNQNFDFTTENKEEVYELTTSLIEHIIAGRPVLTNGPLVYRDFCSASSGCDQEKRSFLSGSSTYLISTKVNEETIIAEVAREKKNSDCSIQNPKDETKQVQKGQIKIGETTYKAVQLVESRMGKIYCRAGSGRQSFYLGEGQEVKKLVVLLDQLVEAINEDGIEFKTNRLGCSRTKVFESSELQFEGNTIIGASQEMLDYKFTGEVLSSEDWSRKQSQIRLKVAELRNDLIAKKSNMDATQLNVNQSENDLKTSESKLSDLKLQLNEAIAANKPTQDSLRSLVKDAETAVDSAKLRVLAAKNLLVVAQNQTKSAETLLADYLKENGTGEQ